MAETIGASRRYAASVLAASADRILARLGAHDLVLDVGGGWEPYARADHVLDLLPYRPVEGARYSEATWSRRDMCDREPWPYDDGEFAFAVCSHTLEDVRDPVYVCSELSRVARAGYIEVPSRLTEQAYGIQGPWAGYGHHHWLVEVLDDGSLEFVFKSHVLDGDERFQIPAGDYWSATDAERFHARFWEGGIVARERIFIGAEEHDAYMARVVRERAPRKSLLRRRR